MNSKHLSLPTPQWAALVDRASKRMQKITVLVDDLLNASWLSEGKLHLKKTLFNLSKAPTNRLIVFRLKRRGIMINEFFLNCSTF